MTDTLRSDGKAVDLDITSDVEKGDIVVAESWHGIAQHDASSGETVAVEIAAREHEIEVGEGITAAKGDILYVDSNGDITDDSGDTAFMKVTSAKDANNIVWGILLPQTS